ncbi:hypothetical protein NXS19_013672 [Fusarium pseudograminearum]|nr:hypothetical protein NXS19_013672 [Fusarium pseudograminearum]
MRVVQVTALLSVATLVPSTAGIALPRFDSGQQSPRRFPRNDTAIATASTTRLSPLIQAPQITTSSQEDDFVSLSSQTSPVESLEVVTLETTSNSGSEAVGLPLTTTELGNDSTTLSLAQYPSARTVLSLTTEQLDHDLANSSTSAGVTLSTQRPLESLSFSQEVSGFTTPTNGLLWLLPPIGIAIKMSSRTRHKIQSMPQYRGGHMRASPAP